MLIFDDIFFFGAGKDFKAFYERDGKAVPKLGISWPLGYSYPAS